MMKIPAHSRTMFTRESLIARSNAALPALTMTASALRVRLAQARVLHATCGDRVVVETMNPDFVELVTMQS